MQEFFDSGNTLSTLVGIIVIVSALFLFKKVASCAAKIVIFAILMGILAFVYYYSQEHDGEEPFGIEVVDE
ncbi:MAG: hypothetical protein IKH88_04075 [Prevotella sp.]|nr:hypothetical protein [Prevotella sp.]